MEQHLGTLAAIVAALQEQCGELSVIRNRCAALEARCATLESRCADFDDTKSRSAQLEWRCAALESGVANIQASKSATPSHSASNQLLSTLQAVEAQLLMHRRKAQSEADENVKLPPTKRRFIDIANNSQFLDYSAGTVMLPKQREIIARACDTFGYAVISIDRNRLHTSNSVVVFTDEKSANEYFFRECDTRRNIVLRRRCPLFQVSLDALDDANYECFPWDTPCLLWKTFLTKTDGSLELVDVIATGMSDNRNKLKVFEAREIDFWRADDDANIFFDDGHPGSVTTVRELSSGAEFVVEKNGKTRACYIVCLFISKEDDIGAS